MQVFITLLQHAFELVRLVQHGQEREITSGVPARGFVPSGASAGLGVGEALSPAQGKEMDRQRDATASLLALGKIGLGPLRHAPLERVDRITGALRPEPGPCSGTYAPVSGQGIAAATVAAAAGELGVTPRGDGLHAAAFPGEIEWQDAPPDTCSWD